MRMQGRSIISFSLFVLTAVAPSSSAIAAPKEAGKIIRIKGEVRIDDAAGMIVASTKESGNRRLIKEGSPFYVGEVIKTFEDARVKIEMNQGGADGNNSVVLGANTRLAIEDVSQTGDKKSTTLQLYQGEIRNDVHAKYKGTGGDSYQVKTQNAVAGVRGTIFDAVVGSDGNALFATHRGKVAVSTFSKGVLSNTTEVVKGMYASVASGMTPTPPQVATLASNPALSQKLEGSLAIDHKGDERLPSSDQKGDSKDKGADKDGVKDGAKNGSGDANVASDDGKPAAPMFREKEKDDRAPASADGSKTAGSTTQMMGMPKGSDNNSSMQKFAGETNMPKTNVMDKVMGQVQGTINQTSNASQNNNTATATKGTVTLCLNPANCP